MKEMLDYVTGRSIAEGVARGELQAIGDLDNFINKSKKVSIIYTTEIPTAITENPTLCIQIGSNPKIHFCDGTNWFEVSLTRRS